MNQVFNYIHQFFTREFNFFYLLTIMFMLSILIYFNYWHGLEVRWLAGGDFNRQGFAGYYLLYLIPFSVAFLLQLLFYKDCAYFKKPWFWIILLLAPAFFSFRVNFTYHQQIIVDNFHGVFQRFYLQSFDWIIRMVVLLFPVFIIWLIKDSTNQPFYGTKAQADLKPFFIMLLIMVPAIVWASTQKDFLQVYPKVGPISLSLMNGWESKIRYLFCELCYGSDFVSIEFFFRGFLILALLKMCGQHCIIPVACFYCMIHFGKPMAEAIGSFFGGMLLGILTYNTRSIWGGLMVHLGIAWLMEIGGFVGRFLYVT